jgi:hypothetical protein
MNRHFTDARYYLVRAAEHLAAGVREEVRPLENRVRGRLGLAERREPTRVERVRADLLAAERRAEGEARDAIEGARERLATYRPRA